MKKLEFFIILILSVAISYSTLKECAQAYREYYRMMYDNRSTIIQRDDSINAHKSRRRAALTYKSHNAKQKKLDLQAYQKSWWDYTPKEPKEGQHDILETINFFENYYLLPRNLLYAITIVESGRKGGPKGKIQPWPWTLNIAGKAHFFENKADTLTFLKNHLTKGITNIDIGCGQINWHQHKGHFRYPEYVLNPTYNISYSAYLLSKHYRRTKSWNKAIALYHSNTPKFANVYLRKVRMILYQLNNK